MVVATQSLYRRYRPRRFSELKGQTHVVRALRDAVAAGRSGQAYLFSGPRGTGKTTTARILAKVLNCVDITDGEPCCACESCVAVEKGTSYDVHELDAASHNGVEAIRDLIEKASLGTPGRHKVYILDEVHMLTKAAEAALLKTLEEPPDHVVFVLATTDPQKMSDTIRSRTQHLQFHLLPGDTLAEHVKWVAKDAGYDLSQDALDAALVQGGGSARDTLSALELIASTGGEVEEAVDLDEFLDALAAGDAGRMLAGFGHAMSMGRNPRTVTEELVRHVRNGFLSLMAPELVVMPTDRLDALAERARAVGPATLVHAIEGLGGTLAEMRHAPDPRVLIEVALVQICAPRDVPSAAPATSAPATSAPAATAAGDTDSARRPGPEIARLVDRIEALEAEVAALKKRPATPTDPATGRAVLGGAARRPVPSDTPAATVADAAQTAASTPNDASATVPAAPTGVLLNEAWDLARPKLKPIVRALYMAGSIAAVEGDVIRFAVPSRPHGEKCAQYRGDVEQVLSSITGTAVSVEFIVGRGRPNPSSAPSSPPTSPSRQPAAAPAAADAAQRPAPASTPAQAPAPVAASPSAPSTPASTPEAAPVSPTAEPSDDPGPPPAPVEAYDDYGFDDDAPPPEAYLPADDEVDISELTDVPPEQVKTPIERLADAFPGSVEMVDDD